MRFTFPSESQHSQPYGLQHEWLETNGLGGYASSTVAGCNTRKYHGLFVANLTRQADRHVLLSTLEETVTGPAGDFSLSSRQHPDVYYPKGHEYITEVTTSPFVETTYQCRSMVISRALLWLHNTNTLLIRYIFHNAPPHTHFSVRPLLAYRSFHTLTHENSAINSHVVRATSPNLLEAGGGIAQSNNKAAAGGNPDNTLTIHPYPALPPLVMQTSAPHSVFIPQPDWCRNVLYAQEEKRGFPAKEDLFMPGQYIFSNIQGYLYFAVGLEPFLHDTKPSLTFFQQAWDKEVSRRKKNTRSYPTFAQTVLAKTAGSFVVDQPHVGFSILAGYHWFNAWGRDSFIALPGLCFCTGRHELGKKILAETCAHAQNGLVPNILSPDGDHAYNSVDASLWYVWAVQQMTRYVPESKGFLKENLWSFLKEIIRIYAQNSKSGHTPMPPGAVTQKNKGVPYTSIDEQGFIEVGTEETQLTWMDAMAYGKAVTPRNGYPVEMNALWYNALVFINELAAEFGEPPVFSSQRIKDMPLLFMERFWVESPRQSTQNSPKVSPEPSAGFSAGHLPANLAKEAPDEFPQYLVGLQGNALQTTSPPQQPESALSDASDTPAMGGYLADVWRNAAPLTQIRPNQIFAIAMPHSLVNDLSKAQSVMSVVTHHLLTPYGLRTLSPTDDAYCPRYEGGPDERDSAYHQGTVWPWLLGAYADALMKTSHDKDQAATRFLNVIAPLLDTHPREAGIGSISEVFDGSSPHRPNGCISQAWSVAEMLRLMETINLYCPGLLERHVNEQGGKKS